MKVCDDFVDQLFESDDRFACISTGNSPMCINGEMDTIDCHVEFESENKTVLYRIMPRHWESSDILRNVKKVPNVTYVAVFCEKPDLETIRKAAKKIVKEKAVKQKKIQSVSEFNSRHGVNYVWS